MSATEARRRADATRSLSSGSTGRPASPRSSRMSTHKASRRARSRSTPPAALLVVGNQNSVSVSEGGSTKLVPANLAVFRVGSNGTLTFVQRYDVAVARKPLWWMGIVACSLTASGREPPAR